VEVTTTLIIEPHDPVIVRDGRPFGGEGQDARTLPWPLPQTVAGAVRTWIGDALGWDWHGDGPDRALQVAVQGPLLFEKDRPLFPCPRDALPAPGDGTQATRPLRLVPEADDGAGARTLWPDGLSLQSPVPPPGQRPEAKVDLPEYWVRATFEDWLAGRDVELDDGNSLRKLTREARIHVAVDPTTGTAREGALFATESLALRPSQYMMCRVKVPDDVAGTVPNQGVLTLGGQRRVSFVRSAPSQGGPWPGCHSLELARALTGTRRLRLVLVTPALFTGGWLPGWLHEGTLQGVVPGTADLRVTLVSAVVGSYLPVSGWSYDRRKPGPRPQRRAAPAGSVYFLQLDRDLTEDDIAALWMQPVSDAPQDCLDGYGLVALGTWTARN